MAPPKTGDEIIVPFLDPAVNQPLTVTWSQNLLTRTKQYYGMSVYNITTGEPCLFFIAAEYYKADTQGDLRHISHISERVEGEGYKLKIDSRLQYGQKNALGELRFIVYHDQGNKPYQHRFVETAVGSAGVRKANEIATALGVGNIAGGAGALAKSFVGEYLHTF